MSASLDYGLWKKPKAKAKDPEFPNDRLYNEFVTLRQVYEIQAGLNFFPVSRGLGHVIEGQYTGDFIEIAKRNYNDDLVLSFGLLVLLHEIKHAIQAKEGYLWSEMRLGNIQRIEAEADKWAREQYIALKYPEKFKNWINRACLYQWDGWCLSRAKASYGSKRSVR